jgi:type I restriction-modification system DNA methylase subunit
MNGMILDRQMNTLESNLISLGYTGSAGKVIHGYKFATTEKRLGQADLIAFADSRLHDISTACIAVKGWRNQDDKSAILRQLSYVGAPIALLAMQDNVELWPVVRADEIKSQPLGRATASLAYEELEAYFTRHKTELSPRSLLNAKREGHQLSFLSIDPLLEAFARDATQRTLVQQYEEAIGSIPQKLRKKYPTELTRLAIQILAARILQDKLDDYDDLRTFDLNSLLIALRNHFPSYFQNLDKEINRIGKDVAKNLYDRLHSEFTFRSLTNDMLAYFYENTFVTKSVRKELGIHYTPRFVAERMFQRLPIEDLPPEKRTVLDGTCGSGNLLLAAYNRLAGLLPITQSPKERHSYLLKHIWGVDKDPFAREIARLSLLLYDLPAGDSWNIKTSDVFDLNPQKEFGEMPHIIVGNPPFREQRATKGEPVELAAQIVDRYLSWLAPGGFLGVVVPLTFLHKVATSQTRSQLLASCDVLEVWHMPEGIIPSSSAATALIPLQI